MEYKDPVFELLSSLEQIVFKDISQTIAQPRKQTAFSEFEQLRKGTGLKIDDFANAMGVSVADGTRVGIKTGETLIHGAQINAPDSGKPAAFKADYRLKLYNKNQVWLRSLYRDRFYFYEKRFAITPQK